MTKKLLVLLTTLLVADAFAGQALGKRVGGANPGFTKCRIAKGDCMRDCEIYTGTLKKGCELTLQRQMAQLHRKTLMHCQT